MRIRFINHACVLIESQDVKILTDPWFSGKAFNESWSLLVEMEVDPSIFDAIDYLWISHEHPDHFHIPTLRSLPDSFKQRVTVLFQENNSGKMFDAFRKLGFPRHRALPHRTQVSLTDRTRVYCYQVGQMDSALAVSSGNQVVLDVNDAEMNARDCRIVRSDLGGIDTVLNQFSIAGYDGRCDYEERLSELASKILHNVSENHRDLGAKVTIPIASMIYFSSVENRYINRFANSPNACARFLEEHGQQGVVLYPGDTYEVDRPHDSSRARLLYSDLYAKLESLSCDKSPIVSLDVIEAAFRKRVADLRDKYPRLLLRRLQAMTVRIPDLQCCVRFSISGEQFEILEESKQADLEIASQPLYYCFAHPFGMQTLGVSARLILSRLLTKSV